MLFEFFDLDQPLLLSTAAHIAARIGCGFLSGARKSQVVDMRRLRQSVKFDPTDQPMESLNTNSNSFL